jgi:hypothetical protein
MMINIFNNANTNLVYMKLRQCFSDYLIMDILARTHLGPYRVFHECSHNIGRNIEDDWALL